MNLPRRRESTLFVRRRPRPHPWPRWGIARPSMGWQKIKISEDKYYLWLSKPPPQKDPPLVRLWLDTPQQLVRMSPGISQRAAEGSSQAAGLSVAGPSLTRAPLLELFCNIPMEPPSPERCESPCSAMLCECAQHLAATCQTHRPSEPGRCLRAQEATRPPAAVKQATALLTSVDASCRSALACSESSRCRPALTPVLRARVCAQALLRRRLDLRARCVARAPATPSKHSGCRNGWARASPKPTLLPLRAAAHTAPAAAHARRVAARMCGGRRRVTS